jgi:hypothetical protein
MPLYVCSACVDGKTMTKLAPVTVEDHTEQFAGRSNTNALLIAKLMKPALHA